MSKKNYQEKDIHEAINDNLENIVFVDIVTEKNSNGDTSAQKSEKKWSVYYCNIYFYGDNPGYLGESVPDNPEETKKSPIPAIKIDVFSKNSTSEKLKKIKSFVQVERYSFINRSYITPAYLLSGKLNKDRRDGHLLFLNGMRHNVYRDYKKAINKVGYKQGLPKIFPERPRSNGYSQFTQYTYVTNFRNGIAFVLQKNKWSIISIKGKKINKEEYDDVSYKEPGFIVVKKSESYGVVNEKGVYISSILNDYQFIGQFFSEGLIPFKKNNKWGFMDKEANVAIPDIFDNVRNFESGLSLVSSDNQQFYIDKSGRFILSFDLVVPSECSLRQALAYRYQGKMRFSHVVGKENLSFWGLKDFRLDFSSIELFNADKSFYYFIGDNPLYPNRSYKLIKETKRWGFTDRTGKTVIDFLYEEVCAFEDGFARVKKNCKWGVIGLKGNEVAPCVYDFIGKFMQDVHLARVCKDKLWGAIDKNGEMAIKLEFGYIHNFKSGLAFACTVDLKKGGFINNQGEKIYPYEFVLDAREPSEFEPLPGGGAIANVCYQEKYFWINTKGEGILNTPPEYKALLHPSPTNNT